MTSNWSRGTSRVLTISWQMHYPDQQEINILMFRDFKMKQKTGVAHRIYYVSSTGGEQIQKRRKDLLWTSIAPSTRKCRVKHWRCYQEYCKRYRLNCIPCTLYQAADYLSFLSLFMKYSSVLVYYQSVRFFHKVFGLQAPTLSHPYLKSILAGISNVPGSRSVQKDPITPDHLYKLSKVVHWEIDAHVLTWAALVIMFRTLLRVSHVTDSPHTLLRNDLHLHKWGMVLLIHSSKTMKKGEEAISIPVVNSITQLLCPVYWTRYILKRFPCERADRPLLSSNKLPKFTYSMFMRVFSLLLKEANIVGKFGSHSLRRGGATFMSNKGLAVQEIKTKGLWKSDVVQKYIVPSLSARKRIDKKFSLCVT